MFLYITIFTMRTPNVSEIHAKFRGRVSEKWSFESNKSTGNYTHGYHRYPAKFVPQLVKQLIEEYTEDGHSIADVFAGCGTTLVEGKLHGRKTVGVDINPVARLITNAKVNPVKPELLDESFAILQNAIAEYKPVEKYYSVVHERIDYWFRDEEKNKIAFLYAHILDIKNEKAKVFYLCALSHILKNCSRWLQDSTKPQVHKEKKISEVFDTFSAHAKRMLKKNKEFYNKLKLEKKLSTSCTIKLADARNTRIPDNSVNAIITSPPYVTSYEYADIHQLTGYWFKYIADITKFRRKFIGTFYSLNKDLSLPDVSPTAQSIVAQLEQKEMKWAREVANYFKDMFAVAKEMYRISAPKGRVCLVIGNTEQKGVNIQSSEAFAEMLYAVGFEVEEVIKRKIPHKIIPTIRDKKTGKFTSLESETSKKVYPNEYIIIARKQ